MADIANSKLLHIDTGILHAEDACIVLIKTDWNASITDELEKGCIEELQRLRVQKIITMIVPGAVEIPFAIRSYWQANANTNRPDAFIALGCVIRGGTPHFEYVCQSVTQGIVLLNDSLPVPTIFGILTVDSEEQALERVGGKHGHKGKEAAITALKMATLNNNFKK